MNTKNICPTIITLLLLISFNCSLLHAQSVWIHAHNDYHQKVPFWGAVAAGAHSIEIDVIADSSNNTLYVAHEKESIQSHRTLPSLYLNPLKQLHQQLEREEKEQDAAFLFLIDLKSSWEYSLPLLIETLKPYQAWLDGSKTTQTRIVISGSIPPATAFSSFPSWIAFDGRLNRSYTDEQKERLGMISASAGDFSRWNGKGRPVQKEHMALKAAVEKAHELGLKFRFWGTPDNPTTWAYALQLGVDFINTDTPAALSEWLKKRPKATASFEQLHIPHHTQFELPQSLTTPPKNILLFIGDGMGLAHVHAAQTLAGGSLNMTKSKHIGLVSTHAEDAYATDSAAGGTAVATGKATNNRAIGVDADGNHLQTLFDVAAAKNMHTALLSTDGIKGATPASFYAHQIDRSASDGIAKDLQETSIHALMAMGSFPEMPTHQVSPTLHFAPHSAMPKQFVSIPDSLQPHWLYQNMTQNLDALASENGLFAVIEGARIDNGGHSNDLPYTLRELLAFDLAIGYALQWAKAHPETLILITADHETGGLVLPQGDIQKGYVEGYFYSDDHTGIPVPLYAFGAGAEHFTGSYANTDVFTRIKKLLQLE